MPTYLYKGCKEHDNEDLIEKNVPIDERDNQICGECGSAYFRKIAFTGLTWSPTRNGGHS